MITREEVLAVGKFQKTHALKGELNMISDIDPEYFLQGNPLIMEYDGILVPYYVESARPKGSTSYLVRIEGVENEKEASQFVNKEIFMLKKDAEEWLEEELEETAALIGYEVMDIVSGEIIGKIEDIEDSTANILFSVSKDGEESFFIPAAEELIEEIDDDAKLIRMRLPEGLLDIDSLED